MLGKKFTYEVLIREGHLDTYGHVNNAKYLELFEEARWEFITANGYGMPVVHRLRQGPVMLGMTLQWKRELKLRQKIRIESYVAEYRKRTGTLRQEMKNEADELCCWVDFTFALFDLDARKLIAPTDAWLTALGLSPSKV